MRVLAIGDTSQRSTYFPDDAEYVNETPYESVLLASVLQTLPRNKVQQALQTVYDDLPDGGRIVVTVPSLEWACKEIVTQNDISLAAYISLYGVESEPHLSGFTMLWLRRCLEDVGFIVVSAKTEAFTMQFSMGDLKQQEKARQHVVIGVKREMDAMAQIDWMGEENAQSN